MLRYSWRKKELSALAKKLEEMNFQPEIEKERKLTSNGIETTKYLTVKSDNLLGSFYQLEGFLQLYGKELSSTDLKLMEIYKREYRFSFPRDIPFAMVAGGAIGAILALLL